VGEHRVAILSYGLWERSFGSDPNVVGRQVHLGGELYTITGVMPKDFRFFKRPVVIWTPLAFAPDDSMNTRNNHFIGVVGRLKPGVTPQQADSDMNVIAARIAKEFPGMPGWGFVPRAYATIWWAMCGPRCWLYLARCCSFCWWPALISQTLC